MRCAGNDFCGTVPGNLAGIVRNFVGVQNSQQSLLKVTHFLRPCSANLHSRASRGLLAGEQAYNHSEGPNDDMIRIC